MEENDIKIIKREIWFKKTTIWANIVICIQLIAVGLAIFQYISFKNYNLDQIERNEKIERTKNAIEAINKVYNSEFLRSTAIIKTKYKQNSIEYIDAYNYILNTYYIISIIYRKNIADNLIIGEAIKNELNIYVETILNENETDNITLKSIIDMKNDINLKNK